MSFKLEIIAFNIESCIAAQDAGADRIELCANPAEGGATPSYGFIKAARAALSIELYVMIRPRGGDFFYSNDEFAIMKEDIQICKETGCDGIVTGMLNKDGSIDTKRCKELTDIAYPLGATFHRAFDRVNDPFLAMEAIIDCGFERILTSGLQQKAIDALPLLKETIIKADDRIIIMPGSGVTKDNILTIAESTGAVEFHSSASKYIPTEMLYTNENMSEELQYVVVNKDEVSSMSSLLKNYHPVA